MLFIINYIKCSVWAIIYYFQKEKSDIILELIIKNIKDSGCVGIKLSQWMLPRIEALYNIKYNKDSKWLSKLEELYDKCNEHPIKYTENIYHQSFGNQLIEDYNIVSLISSASIGQVYKIQCKQTKQYYALKCIHPDINFQINFFDIIIKILYNTPVLNVYVRYYVPLNLSNFIHDFKIQTNLINEANNCLKFYNIYKDNDYIIIPKIEKVSKGIIVMTYEDGDKYHEDGQSEYINQKIWGLIRLFTKNNEIVNNFIHGDMHKGNWKIRSEKSDVKLVVYDFGFCWKLPRHINREVGNIINESFLKIALNYDSLDEKDRLNESIIIDELSVSSHLLLNKKVSIELIKKEIFTLLKNSELKLNEPTFLLRLIINAIRNNNIVIDSYIIQSLILHNQLHENIKKTDKCVFSNVKIKNIDEAFYHFFNSRVRELVNYCKINKIFSEYTILLENEIKSHCGGDNIVKEDITINNINYDFLKKLATQ